MHQALTSPPLARDAMKKRRSLRKRKILIGSAGAALVLIVALFLAGKREKPIPVTTEKAVLRTILQTVSATGKIQPETEVKISPEVAGEIIELPVEDGKAIKKGDLLVKIKPDSYKALLEQQEAAISAAKATNLQQKATMLKTAQDMKRAEEMRVADLNHMEARVDVNENDVVNVKAGDKASIKIDAYPERRFHGTVYQIANTGKTTGTGTQEEVTNFEVKIRIDETDLLLKPGLSSTADIETASAKDVIAVPMQAVTI